MWTLFLIYAKAVALSVPRTMIAMAISICSWVVVSFRERTPLLRAAIFCATTVRWAMLRWSRLPRTTEATRVFSCRSCSSGIDFTNDFPSRSRAPFSRRGLPADLPHNALEDARLQAALFLALRGKGET